jgi:MoaA/NifB/PqqE/SkfB family radical SAM enzyme
MYSPIRHIPAVFFKQKPVQLTFFVTSRCNAKCPYCFYLQNNVSCPQQSPELALDEIQKISSSMGNLLWLAFSGGEIYLRKDLPAISRIFYENNKPVYMLYPTNGMLPDRIYAYTETILRDCPESTIVVKLSLDDLYEAHDLLRATPGSFAKTLQTYQLLGELKAQYSNFELGVNTVFCAQNQDRMQDIIDYVGQLKYITTHTLSLVRGELKHTSYQQVDMNKYWHYTNLLADRIRNNDSPHYQFKGGKLKIAQDILQRNLIRETYNQQRRLIPCFAGKANLVLTETGDVYPCESFSDAFGNVRDYDYNLSEILRSRAAKDIIQQIENACCYCTHECYFITNIMLNPMLYPAVLKEYLKLPAA